jgi:hypothetical protein
VRTDHGESITQRNDYAGIGTGEFRRKFYVIGHRSRGVLPGSIEPMDSKQVECMGVVDFDMI